MISQKLEQILNKAIKRANDKRHEFLTLENVLFSMLDDENVAEILVDCGANMNAYLQGSLAKVKKVLQGLASAAKTKLEIMVPELLEANGLSFGAEVPYELLARRFSVAHAPGG